MTAKHTKGPEAMPKTLSKGEEEFALHLRIHNISLEREFEFAPGRKWRFDFADRRRMVAVEIEGGTSFGMSRHSRGDGFIRDCRKYNRAARDGWKVFRFTTEMVRSGEAINTVMEAIA